MGSEVGLVDLEPEEVIETGQVGPGEVLAVDTRARPGDPQPGRQARGGRPATRTGVGAPHMSVLVPDPIRTLPAPAGDELVRAPAALRLRLRGPSSRARADGQHGRGRSLEHGRRHADPTARAHAAGVYAYFRQRFAQVTNPPIDPLREAMVMSLRMHLGRRGSPLVERRCGGHAARGASAPAGRRDGRRCATCRGFPTEIIDAIWDPADGTEALPAGARIARRARPCTPCGPAPSSSS